MQTNSGSCGGGLSYDCLPPVWRDDKAIYPYFTTFKRPRAVDPEAHDRKMHFWRRLLAEFCRRNKIAALSVDDLRRLFRRRFDSVDRDMEPECLGAVLHHLRQPSAAPAGDPALDSRRDDDNNYDDFQLVDLADEQRGIAGRMAGTAFDWLVRRPMSYAFGSGNPLPPSVPDQLQLVDACQLRRLMRRVQQDLQDAPVADEAHPESPGKVKGPHRFASCLNVCRKRDFDGYLESLLPHLPTRKLVVQRLISAGFVAFKTVKFGRTGSEELLVWSHSADSPLSESAAAVDTEVNTAHSIMNLMHTIGLVEKEEELLRRRVEAVRDECRGLLRDGRKDKALGLMRRVKALRALMADRQQQLVNLEAMLVKVQMARSNMQVLDAFRVTNQWFKSSRAADADSLKSAVEAFDEIRDTLEEQQEIGEAMKFTGGAGFNEGELESELDRLLEEDAAAAAPSKKSPQAASDLDTRFSELDVDSLNLPDVADLPLPGKPDESLDELRNKINAL